MGKSLQPLDAKLLDAVRGIIYLDLTLRDTPEDIEEIDTAVNQLRTAVSAFDERVPTPLALAAIEVLNLEPFDRGVPGTRHRCMHAQDELRNVASFLDPSLKAKWAELTHSDFWTRAFWSCYNDLTQYEFDWAMVVLPAWAAKLYPTHKHVDPYQLAHDEFAKGTAPDPGFDYEPGT